MENIWDILLREVPTRIDELVSVLNTSLPSVTAIRALLSSKAQKCDKLDQLDDPCKNLNTNGRGSSRDIFTNIEY